MYDPQVNNSMRKQDWEAVIARQFQKASKTTLIDLCCVIICSLFGYKDGSNLLQGRLTGIMCNQSSTLKTLIAETMLVENRNGKNVYDVCVCIDILRTKW